MGGSTCVLTFDIGTTGVKTCLMHIDGRVTAVASAYAGYGLNVFDNGGAEQDPDEWWAAVCATAREALDKAGTPANDVAAVSFCSQMQGLVLVDETGRAVRPAMSYMDSRARSQHERGIAGGLCIGGMNASKLLRFLLITRAVPASVKDPVWKYAWVKENEPEVFSRVYKWLDVKEYLIARLTGNFLMTEGSAYATLLMDTRGGARRWSRALCRLFGVDMRHLPQIIRSTDIAGEITERAAAELGLAPGTKVYGGGGDAELIGVGAGSMQPGDTHIYLGTSGWVSTVTDRQVVDVSSLIASIVGPSPGYYHYFAEMETAGKCLEWVRDHLALDEIGVYLEKRNVTESLEAVYSSLYDYLCEVVGRVPAGSGGVIFTPWFHGNRCPFEDEHARGMFFNIGLETGKSMLIRAVIEGICYHCRWMLEAQQKKVRTSNPIRFVGGGAASPVICQILADVLGLDIVTVDAPQNVGAVGAAVVIAAGMGLIGSVSEAAGLVPESRRFHPNAAHRAVHERNYTVFKRLYKDNKQSFSRLNRDKRRAETEDCHGKDTGQWGAVR